MVASLNTVVIYFIILTLENVGTFVNYHGNFIISAQVFKSYFFEDNENIFLERAKI